jgi:hypothetical protein
MQTMYYIKLDIYTIITRICVCPTRPTCIRGNIRITSNRIQHNVIRYPYEIFSSGFVEEIIMYARIMYLKHKNNASTRIIIFYYIILYK